MSPVAALNFHGKFVFSNLTTTSLFHFAVQQLFLK